MRRAGANIDIGALLNPVMSHSDIALSVRGLSKAYTISKESEKESTLAETILKKLRSPLARVSSNTETFWALNDLNFDVQKGDVVGVLGRNGAGKSTLFKILSRITEPTAGVIDLYGRVGSLLEVGTGFHPELTGRENIFLNGAILGMSRAEISQQFDAIVDFAGVEKFLDTPVKRYSSGMYVKLAFAVAAHLQSDIMVIDEVLAVGDAEFQRKCLGKIRDVATAGRTVLFVSHNIVSITTLCSSCLVLKNGALIFSGNAQDGAKLYTDASEKRADHAKREIRLCRPSWATPLIQTARLLDSHGDERTCLPSGCDITFEMSFSAPEAQRLRQPVMGVVIHRAGLGLLGVVNTRMTGFDVVSGSYASGTMKCVLRRFAFLPGYFTVDLWLGDGPGDLDAIYGYLSFELEHADVYGTGRPPMEDLGISFFDAEWHFAS